MGKSQVGKVGKTFTMNDEIEELMKELEKRRRTPMTPSIRRSGFKKIKKEKKSIQIAPVLGGGI